MIRLTPHARRRRSPCRSFGAAGRGLRLAGRRAPDRERRQRDADAADDYRTGQGRSGRGQEAVRVGPDLDKLAQYAKQANQGSLQQFVETSITTPGNYIQPGYQNVMPATYGNLPAKQIADLVAFLTQKQ